MKRFARPLCVALCLALPLVWVGCASTPTRQSTGEYVDDSVITTKVKTELGADKVLSLYQISVETYNGVVQLSGFVNSQEVSENAAAIARKVGGVREVKNSLVVKPQ
ncbi:MAG: BON domain-containing protein [Deltaproteobacteria bacterium]|nr:BON domain-containing protein [Deltaproteobacteria bacterium]